MVIYMRNASGEGQLPGRARRVMFRARYISASPLRTCGSIGPMRPVAALTAVVLAGLAIAATAQAVQSITATPKTVKRTDTQTVHGRGWPVIEFCSRTVRVSVRSAQ